MRCNLAKWDRILRFILGIIFTTWAIVGGPPWAWLGIYLFFTSGWGLCPIYSSFKISTLKDNETSAARSPK